MNPVWTLTIHDQDGNTVSTATKKPNEIAIVQGCMNSLAEALPEISGLSRFFHDPDEQAAAAYAAYREAWENTYDHALPTWAEIKAMPHKQELVAIWRATAKAATAADYSLN